MSRPDDVSPVLPDRAGEDDPVWGEEHDADDEERLRAEVPPHWS